MKTIHKASAILLFFSVLSELLEGSESLLSDGTLRRLAFTRPTSNQHLAAASSASTSSSTKTHLLELLESTPSNAPTPRRVTNEILATVRVLEKECPTKDSEVLNKLAGTWELLWTAQDPDSPESNRLFLSWINPLENQSYSNNPGRSNPILPRALQDNLEEAGLVASDTSLRSTQTIDPSQQQVVNVVALRVGGRRASLTVNVDYWPNANNPRQIDVKFQSCRVGNLFTIPLGIVGPTGWLRTVYIDDDLRVTRGHKGSVFVLQRPAKKKKTNQATVAEAE